MTKYTCTNCGAEIKAKEVDAKIDAGFRLEHIACPKCGQHTVKETKSIK